MKSKKSVSMKAVVVLMALVLLIGCGVGGTLAWLMDKTDAVTNTFTVGDIEITLDEAKVNQDGQFLDKNDNVVYDLTSAERVTSNTYQAIPGKTYSKDPTLTVRKGNEKCYLFVEFTETNSPDTYYTYDFALDNTDSGWSNGDGTNIPANVWYIIVEETAADATNDTVYHLLVNDKIQVKDTVTKENMSDAADAKLEFKAYAVQHVNDATNFTTEQAWDIAQDGTLTATNP